jgi:nucleotide-binding universal stress UspA family protein
MKVLVAVDGSDFTRRMIELLTQRRDIIGSAPDITLLAVVPALPPHATRWVERDALADYYADEACAMLEHAERSFAAAGVATKSEQATGDAVDVIAARARSGRYDVIVMGSHGHSALGSIVLGSVVTGVMARCEVPVLVVR